MEHTERLTDLLVLPQEDLIAIDFISGDNSDIAEGIIRTFVYRNGEFEIHGTFYRIYHHRGNGLFTTENENDDPIEVTHFRLKDRQLTLYGSIGFVQPFAWQIYRRFIN